MALLALPAVVALGAQGKSPLAWTDVQFLDQQRGWACSNRSRVIRTSDGGKTWQESVANANGGITSLKFLDASVGFAAGNDGCVLKSLDGGCTWTVSHVPDGRMLYSVDFGDSAHGWAVGTSARIFHTADAGRTWKSQSSPVKEKTLTSVWAESERSALVTGVDGILMKTGDGGETWQCIPMQTRDTLWAARIAADGWGACVGNNGVLLETSDGGRTWRREAIEPRSDLHDVVITDDYAVAIGSAGLVLVRERNRAGWTAIDVGQRVELLSAAASASNDFWVCGVDRQPLHVPFSTIERGMRP